MIISAIKITFRSAAFGLNIFFCTKIFERIMQKHQKPSGIMKSPVDIAKFLFGTLAATILSSLAAWFNPVYFPNDIKKFTLFQFYQRTVVMQTFEGVRASVLVISMIIPIGVIVVFTPILLICLEHKKAQMQN
jgi:hypothetical protein